MTDKILEVLKCKLLDIEIDMNYICPISYQFKERFLCYENCGFSPLRSKNKKIIIQSKLEKFV